MIQLDKISFWQILCRTYQSSLVEALVLDEPDDFVRRPLALVRLDVVRTQVDDQVGHVVAGVPVAAVENKCCG
jgi:hypothetical protein